MKKTNRKARRGLAARFGRETEGSVAVEFAIGSIVLILATFGIMDISNMMRVEESLETVTKEGARYAAVHGSQALIPKTVSEVQTVLDDYGRKLALEPSKLNVQISPCCYYPSNYPDGALAGTANLSAGNTITVTATYPYRHFLAGLFPDITLQASSTYTITR